MIHEYEAVVGTLHDDMPLCIDVLVDDAVDKGLSYGVMGRRLFQTNTVFHHERTGQRLYQAVIHPYIELVEVGFPQTIRIDTVRPPHIGVVGRDTFPIIHEIHRVARTVDNAVVLAEHQ